MKLFTFSGISSSITNVNNGDGIKQFAQDIISAFPGTPPSYNPTDGTGHFRSYVNLLKLLGEVEDAVQLDGSEVLNEEAETLAKDYAMAINNAMSADPKEEVLILAHSQGNNNMVFALKYLFQNAPQFFESRAVRCAMFDPKVGANHVEELITQDKEMHLEFLFFQSENDILGDQSMFIPKFIDEFPHGNHIWVRGTDHTSIREWKTFSTEQSWMILEEFQEFEREVNKERIDLQREFGAHLNTVYLGKLQAFKRDYEMNDDKLAPALLGFLQGKLPKKFLS
ncbi:alpha/beta hydrolase [Pedosphaera parvula]|uniref:Uncharacterized protein n=1 Tax=Pedosphaera parvula (strain Ellin514) TaxID=320771 RepID=B9XA88_PEDPL|nr:alpha/beta hydrolase [Pedosphaera parvula]EEF63429.1 hypothetical protein Cflav_PD6064 [Pedosphaera parvula Ellin514]